MPGAPFIQFALCPGDCASLYRLKQDIFTALTTGLGILSAMSTGSSSDEQGSDQRYVSNAANRAAESNGLSTPRGTSNRVRKSFTFEMPLSPSSKGKSNPVLSTPSKNLQVSEAMPDKTLSNLRTATEDERVKLIARLTAAAATSRRIPLPPRHRVRPRNSHISPQKKLNLELKASILEEEEEEEDEEDEMDEEEFGERRNAMSIVEETAEFSNELRDAIVNLKNGSIGNDQNMISPTPFRFSASYIWWGNSGSGVALAAEMVRKGEDAFAWR